MTDTATDYWREYSWTETNSGMFYTYEQLAEMRSSPDCYSWRFVETSANTGILRIVIAPSTVIVLEGRIIPWLSAMEARAIETYFSPIPQHRYPMRGVIQWGVDLAAEQAAEDLQLNQWEPSHYPISRDFMADFNEVEILQASERATELLNAHFLELSSPQCLAIFKNQHTGCPYSGDTDSCDKTERCCTELNGSSEHFVGFRRIQSHPINNKSCQYYSHDWRLRCAVNPKGQCEGCKDFKALS